MSSETLVVLALVGFAAGWVDAIAGGGGLLSLPAIFLAGVPPHVALGTNKFQAICGTTAATLRYAWARKIDFVLLRSWVPLCLVGSALGTAAVLLLRPELVKPLFLPVFLLIGMYMVRKKDAGLTARPELKTARRFWISTVLVFAVGFYDGFFGPGTGIFLFLVMVLGLGYDALNATGSVKLMNWATNLASLLVFLARGKVFWPVALAMGLCNSVGGLVGSHMAIRKGQGLIRRIVVLVVFAMSAKLAWDLWSS